MKQFIGMLHEDALEARIVAAIIKQETYVGDKIALLRRLFDECMAVAVECTDIFDRAHYDTLCAVIAIAINQTPRVLRGRIKSKQSDLNAAHGRWR